MIVTAMLNWYDEPPALLRQAVRGAATIADRIVAADGAFSFVPDKASSSPSSQRRAIKSEAEKCGLEVEFLKPQVWAGQVTKRSAVLQRAKEGSDWVMVLDSDWKISGDRIAVRSELQHLLLNGYEQVEVVFVTPDDVSRPLEQKAANIWHVEQRGTTQQLPLIYKALPQMEYWKNHWSLLGEREDGQKLAFFGARGIGRQIKGEIYHDAKNGYLHAPHIFEHRCLFREEKQILRAREYIRLRDENVAMLGFET